MQQLQLLTLAAVGSKVGMSLALAAEILTNACKQHMAGT
jgi:hypothetical protein